MKKQIFLAIVLAAITGGANGLVFANDAKPHPNQTTTSQKETKAEKKADKVRKAEAKKEAEKQRRDAKMTAKNNSKTTKKKHKKFLGIF
jgi:hypothetical protein